MENHGHGPPLRCASSGLLSGLALPRMTTALERTCGACRAPKVADVLTEALGKSRMPGLLAFLRRSPAALSSSFKTAEFGICAVITCCGAPESTGGTSGYTRTRFSRCVLDACSCRGGWASELRNHAGGTVISKSPVNVCCDISLDSLRSLATKSCIRHCLLIKPRLMSIYLFYL